MPMVPQYQGGIPSVQDSGSPGMSPVEAPKSSFDYESVMKKAMSPINEWADSYAKTQEVLLAKEVKAESDDRESQVINAWNKVMMGPDGFMNKKGKNAIDSFESAMEQVQKEVGDIMTNTSPQVREALQSRIDQRTLANVTRAQQHLIAQKQQYFRDSRNARIETYGDDIALHANDHEYVNKSIASVMLEIDAMAHEEGWASEVTKQMKDKQIALIQAKRYQTWGEQDPVTAYADFRATQKDLDPDVRVRIQKSLFSQAQGLLAYDLALSPLYSNDESDFHQEDYSAKYNTKLTDAEEKEFQKWAKENNREKDVFDYDLRGAWKEIQSGSMSEDDRGHLGDKYKKPNHPTFSTQSIYNGVDGKVGGTWSTKNGQTVFTPGKKLTKSEEAFLKQYFNEVEPEAMLNSSLVETWLDNPLAPTGNAFIDSLPKDERLAVTIKAQSMFKAGNAEKKQQLTIDGQNAIVEAATTGTVTNPLTLDQYVSVYGPKEGEKEYKAHVEAVNMNMDMFTFKGLCNTDIDSIVKASKPEVGSANYAEDYKRYETRLKAANEIKKQRTADPVQFAIENEMNGYKPLDFSNTQSLTDQLQTRRVNMNEIADQWGTSKLLFSQGEAKALVAILDTMEIDARVGLLSTIGDAIGMEGIGATATQLKGGNSSYALAIASIKDVGEDGISVGEKYLRGKDAIAQKRVTIDQMAEYGLKASIYSALGDSDSAEAVFTDPQTLNNTAELVTGVYGYNYASGGSVQESIEQAVGVLYEHNGKKIVLPKNIRGTTLFGDDFDDQVLKHANELRKSKETFYVAGAKLKADELADLLPSMKLQTYKTTEDGGMTYQLIYNGEVVQTKNDVYLMEIQ